MEDLFLIFFLIVWNSTKERTKLGKINRMGIHGKSLQKSNETDALKREKCVSVYT